MYGVIDIKFEYISMEESTLSSSLLSSPNN